MEHTTKQFKKRNAIYECLCSTDTHPSAEMVHEMLQSEHPDISLATVYRNLARFKAEGKIMSVATVHGTERFDGNTEPHVHFICNGCGSVQDLMQMELPTALAQAAASLSGANIQSCQLTFTGYCSECKNQNLEEAI